MNRQHFGDYQPRGASRVSIPFTFGGALAQHPRSAAPQILGNGDDNVNAFDEAEVEEELYNDNQVEYMLKEREKEVVSQFEAEQQLILKDRGEISTKLTESSMHLRRQKEVRTGKIFHELNFRYLTLKLKKFKADV